MPAGRGIPGLPRHHRIFVAPGRQARADARIPCGCLNEGRYRSTSRDLQCGVTPLAGRGRTGSVSWGRDGTPHQPFSGEGPARRRWQHIARNALSAVGCPTLKSVGS